MNRLEWLNDKINAANTRGWAVKLVDVADLAALIAVAEAARELDAPSAELVKALAPLLEPAP